MATSCVLCQVENKFLCIVYTNVILRRNELLPFVVISSDSVINLSCSYRTNDVHQNLQKKKKMLEIYFKGTLKM
jgi:hypothetical protein